MIQTLTMGISCSKNSKFTPLSERDQYATLSKNKKYISNLFSKYTTINIIDGDIQDDFAWISVASVQKYTNDPSLYYILDDRKGTIFYVPGKLIEFVYERKKADEMFNNSRHLLKLDKSTILMIIHAIYKEVDGLRLKHQIIELNV